MILEGVFRPKRDMGHVLHFDWLFNYHVIFYIV
jgi:hypothetical protein